MQACRHSLVIIKTTTTKCIVNTLINVCRPSRTRMPLDISLRCTIQISNPPTTNGTIFWSFIFPHFFLMLLGSTVLHACESASNCCIPLQQKHAASHNFSATMQSIHSIGLSAYVYNGLCFAAMFNSSYFVHK